MKRREFISPPLEWPRMKLHKSRSARWLRTPLWPRLRARGAHVTRATGGWRCWSASVGRVIACQLHGLSVFTCDRLVVRIEFFVTRMSAPDLGNCLKSSFVRVEGVVYFVPF